MPRGWKVMFAPTTEEAAEEASQFRFCRMDSDLILVYGRKESELFAVADDAFLDTLTESEKMVKLLSAINSVPCMSIVTKC